MSYLEVPVKIDATMSYRIVGPSDTPPTPATGYTIDPDPIQVSGSSDKYWLEYRIISA